MAVKPIVLRAPDTQNLNTLLRALLPAAVGHDLSHGKIRRLIFSGAVSLGGRSCRNPSALVRAGESVTVRWDEEKALAEKSAHDIAFDLTARDVLFEDEAVIVVNKPAFFPVEAGMVKSRDNLHAAVVRYLFAAQKMVRPNALHPPYAGIMHRLDHETSGVILFTKSRAANAAVHAAFETHAVQKTYRAVVQIPVSSTGMTPELASTGMTSELASTGMTPELASMGVTPELASTGMTPELASMGVTSELASTEMTPELASIGMTSELASMGMTSELASTEMTQKLSLSGLTRQSFTVELPLGRISPKSQAAKWGHVAEADGGVYSRTDFTVVGTGTLGGKTVAYLDCQLYTGRTHQIRVHLASVGLPLLGDTLYGGIPYKRIMLHAHTLAFPHPVTGKTITVTAPLPDGFAL